MFIREAILAILGYVAPFLWNRCSKHQWLIQKDVLLEDGTLVRLKTCLKCGKREIES